MINITVKSINKDETSKVKEILHNALVGSPAYINSEIAICDTDDTTFELVAGNNNNKNVNFNVFITSGEIKRNY